jgi:ubiquinone/menaquinone biosynthesis C-methylase UbiE
MPPSRDAAYHLAEWKKSSGDVYLARILEPLNVCPGAAVLDIGCGSGYVSAYLSREKSVRRNLGLEIAPDVLRLARDLSVGRTRHPVHWICGQAEALPLPSGSLDHVVCRVVLPYTVVPQAVAEISRCLTPSGSALFLLHPWTLYARKLSLHPRKWKSSVALMLILLTGVIFHWTGILMRPKLWRWRIGETFQTLSRFRKVLGQHGLSVASAQSEPEFIVYAVKSRKAMP